MSHLAWRIAWMGAWLVAVGGARAVGAPPPKAPAGRSYRLPSVDLTEPVIWGSTCLGAKGFGLAFGGQDQHAEDGRAPTRIRTAGQWEDIRQELRSRNPLQALHGRAWALRGRQKALTARARWLYFDGRPTDETARAAKAELIPAQGEIAQDAAALCGELQKASGLDEYASGQAAIAARGLKAAADGAAGLAKDLAGGLEPDAIKRMDALRIALEEAAEPLDAEPPPRALSPLAYDAASGLFILFGGDHLDYLTNDTWVFDPARRRWMQRHPPAAPPPRANHAWKAAPDGTALAGRAGPILTGGYTYTSNTDYCGGQYRDLADGDWTYDVAANAWSGQGQPVSGGPASPAGRSRTYRTGPFHPDFYLEGDRPDAAAVQARLADLPANTWAPMQPPRLPRLNRDWGSAVLDADRDVILRWSGGHSAHGGTDVLHYHLRTNRWVLHFPVEFPLGQLYSNTSYPEGFNFNLRPWVTGHTYQSYAYDATARRMIFTGQRRHQYLYDPDLGDWIGRAAKPREMSYDSCYYTLTMCSTPQGSAVWTQQGSIFRYDASAGEWRELKMAGLKLPGSVVDNSTVLYDSKRDRLIFARKGYGDAHKYDGELYALDLKTLAASALSPKGRAAAGEISYLCQIRYDAASDLMLVGATLPPDGAGIRRTPAYDPAGNRWVSMRIGGTDPSGPKGRNVSLGLMYDAKRGLFWAVDTDSKVFTLRLDPKTADVRDLAPQE